jgi:pimeloyl-ACP methyl ester carboxylesterase
MLEGVVRKRVPSSEPGVELATLDWGGDGELIVIHHANGFCAATYAPIAIALRDRVRVIGVDARGHGDSTSVDATEHPESYRWERMATDYSAVLAHLIGTTGRDRIRLAIGHSFGGVLTLAAAAARPGLVDEALLLDPVILPPVAERKAFDDRVPDLASGARRRRAVFPTREAAYDHFATRGLFEAFRPEALALYVGEGMGETESGEVRLKCDPTVEAAVFDQGSAMDVFTVAPQVRARTRLVHATRGNFPVAAFEALASQMPHASVESCDSGHLFPMERPEFVIDRVDT